MRKNQESEMAKQARKKSVSRKKVATQSVTRTKEQDKSLESWIWDAACSIRGAKDDLLGLKENIIIGHLIPAGSGIHRYQDVEFVVEQDFYDEEILPLSDADDLIPGLGSEAETTEEATADDPAALERRREQSGQARC